MATERLVLNALQKKSRANKRRACWWRTPNFLEDSRTLPGAGNVPDVDMIINITDSLDSNHWTEGIDWWYATFIMDCGDFIKLILARRLPLRVNYPLCI